MSNKKNKTNQSTTYISNNISSRTGAVTGDKEYQPDLYYASLPIEKRRPDWNQSASTWRHSSHRYSFSKDSRFKDYSLNYTDILQPQLPTTKSKKTCSFGKGKKRPISQTVLRNAKEKPSPNAYNLTGFTEKKEEKGKSFGIGWKDYEKVYIQHRKDVYSGHFTTNNPSSKYEVREKPGKTKRHFSAYGRLKMYTEKMADKKRHVPGPHHNVKDRHLQKMQGLNERNFSFGQRLDFSAPANNYPGAQYMINGFCHRFSKLEKKNFPASQCHDESQ